MEEAFQVGSDDEKLKALRERILQSWSVDPSSPARAPRPLPALLSTIPSALPPNFGVGRHEYFDRWKGVGLRTAAAAAAAADGGVEEEEREVRRALRKARFFLHPDRIPRNLGEDMRCCIKTVWDTLAEAEERWEKQRVEEKAAKGFWE